MSRPPRPPRDGGLALVAALLMLLGALILGASVARTAFASMASSRLERDRMVARAAAEAALADAEADIDGGAEPDSDRAGWFKDAGGGFANGCGRGSQDLGLCLPAAPPAPAVWQALDLAGEAGEGDAGGVPLVPYGRYTGAVFATGSGILPARLPGYLVEALAPAGAGPPPDRLYRITAIGFGTRATTQVVLQAVVRRAAVKPAAGGSGDGAVPAGMPGTPVAGASDTGGAVTGAQADGTPADEAPADGTPPGRISWREVANWPELHARATH